MSFLVVGGVTVSVKDAHEPQPDFNGEKQRMQDGALRVMVIGTTPYKRKWSVTTTIITDAAAATLLAQLNSTTLPVTCSGDLLGGAVSCIPELTANEPVNVLGALKRQVSFTLHEV